MGGPKPKSPNQKLREGNLGKRRINDDEFRPLAERPTCPAHLKGQAKAEFARLADELGAYGMLSALDRSALAMAATLWGRYVECERRIAEEAAKYPDTLGVVEFSSAGVPLLSPLVKISHQCIAEYRHWCDELGLTPDSRIGMRPMTARPKAPAVVDEPGSAKPEPEGGAVVDWSTFAQRGAR